jgi:hypothetical protein
MIQLFYSIDDSQLIYKGERRNMGRVPSEEVWGRGMSVDKPTDMENYIREDYPFD